MERTQRPLRREYSDARQPKALTLTEDFRTVAPETEDGEVTYKNADVKAHSGSGSDARLL